MEFMHRFTGAFRNKLIIGNRHAQLEGHMSSHDSRDDMERKLFGMDVQEQSIVRHVLTMIGDAVLVKEDTFATDKKNNPYYLEKGRKVRITDDPLTLDRQGNARINILDESNNVLSMRLTDYIQDIYADR